MTDSRKHIVGPTERREEIAAREAFDRWFRTMKDERSFAGLLRNQTLLDQKPGFITGYQAAKADAILASDDGREMVRELTEAIEPVAKVADIFKPQRYRGPKGRFCRVHYDDGHGPWQIDKVATVGDFRRLAAIHAKAKEWLGK